MKIMVKSPKAVERIFIRIYQRYYKCTTPVVHNNSHPFQHSAPQPPPRPPNKKKNFSRTRSEQSCYKVLTCSQEFFVKLLPVLDYLIKSGKKRVWNLEVQWCRDRWSTWLVWSAATVSTPLTIPFLLNFLTLLLSPSKQQVLQNINGNQHLCAIGTTV